MSTSPLNLELYYKCKENFDKKNNLNEKLAILTELQAKKCFLPVQQDLEQTKSCLENICSNQEKINNKKAVTLLKFQEESKKICVEQNILVLPQENHKDFQNIIQSKAEVENLITSLQEGENKEISEFTMQHAADMSSIINKQLTKDIQEFRFAEGLFNNINNLKKELNSSEAESTLHVLEQSSDIGCYKLEENSSNRLSRPFLSTPISNVQSTERENNSYFGEVSFIATDSTSS